MGPAWVLPGLYLGSDQANGTELPAGAVHNMNLGDVSRAAVRPPTRPWFRLRDSQQLSWQHSWQRQRQLR